MDMMISHKILLNWDKERMVNDNIDDRVYGIILQLSH